MLSRKPDYHKTPSLYFPLPHYNDTVLYSKTNFYKSQPPQLPQQFEGGCYLANRITTKLHLHFPLPHYNDTVLYSKTNFYKSQPPRLTQQFEGGAISQTGLPQNSISTSPSPITMTPCYILKRTFTKVNLLNYPNNWGGAISQTGLPQNSISTSPSPITMTPCYILKRTFTKVNLLNYPNNLRGGAISQTGTTKLHLNFPLPHYNDTVLYSKTNFYKSQPPRLPQQFEGGAISQTGLPQNSISTSPSPITMTPCYILKRTFTKVNLLNYPNNWGGGVLSRKPDYHKTPSPLPPPPLQ